MVTMKKRKISLVLVITFAILSLLFVYGGSYLIAQKIESEVDKLFPEIATKSRVEGLDFSYREGLRIENFYAEFITEERKSSAVGKNIHASINWGGFIFSGGKLRINSLYMSSFSVRISKTLETLLDSEVENILNQTVQNILKRETISGNFNLRIDEFYIVDSEEKVLKVQPIRFSRKKSKELRFFISNAQVDTVTAFNYLSFEMDNYHVSDSVTKILTDFKKRITSSSEQEFLTSKTLKAQNLIPNIDNYLTFEKMRFSVGLSHVKVGPVDSLFGLELEVNRDKKGTEFSFSLGELYSSLDTLSEGKLRARLKDSVILLDTFQLKSKKGGDFALSGAVNTNGNSANITLGLRKIKTSVLSSLFRDFPNEVKGVLSLQGRFIGDLSNKNSWSYAGELFIEKFQLLKSKRLKSFAGTIPLPITMDSLVMHSINFSHRKISADLSASVIDTSVIVPFRPFPKISTFSYDRVKKELYVDTICEIPMYYMGKRMKVSAGDFTIAIDSLRNKEVWLKDLDARSITVSAPASFISLKRIKSLKKPPFHVPSNSISIKNIEIYDSKKRVHPDSLGYYYPKLFSANGISLQKTGKKDRLQYLFSLDSMMITKKGRLSGLSASLQLDDTLIPFYTLSLKNLFLHEKSIPFSLGNQKSVITALKPLFPKSKAYIGNVIVQNDSTTVLLAKKLRINYLQDTLYRFSFDRVFHHKFADMRYAKGQLIRNGTTFRVKKGTMQKCYLTSFNKSLTSLKRDLKSSQYKKYLHWLPSRDFYIEDCKLENNDTVKVRIKKLKYTVKDTNLIYISMYTGRFFDKLQCKWGEFTLDLSKGVKLKEAIVSQLNLYNVPALKLKKGGKSFNPSMISRFKKALSFMEKYTTKEATIKVTQCNGEVDSLGKMGLANFSLKRTKDKDEYSRISLNSLVYPGFDKVNSFKTGFKITKKKWFIDDLKVVSGDNTRLFASGYIMPVNLVPCSLDVKVENFKLSNIQKHYFKKTNAIIRGGAYANLTLKGNLFDRNSWVAKRASITLLNASVENLPLQKGKKITKYAPTFKKLKFSKIVINPVDLKKSGQFHIKYLEAKSAKLNFTGWGNLDFKGRFYFEMKGRVHKASADKLPRLTRMALNEASRTEYGKFYAKLYGDTKKQYLVPERGIAGKVIRSQFRKIGAGFRNLFK